MGKAAEAREEAIECRIRALRALRAKTAHGETTSIASQNQSVRLPKLELSKFGGDALEWSTFREQYEAAVDNSDLQEVPKFVYLRSLLVGEARKCVESLTVVKEYYDIACKALKDRFARPSQIIFAHIDKLLKLGLADGGDLNSVQDTYPPFTCQKSGETGDRWRKLWCHSYAPHLEPTARHVSFGVGERQCWKRK